MDSNDYENSVLISKKEDGSVSFSLVVSMDSLQLNSYVKLDSFPNKINPIFAKEREKICKFPKFINRKYPKAYSKISQKEIFIDFDEKGIKYLDGNHFMSIDQIEFLDNIHFDQAQF